MSLQVNERVNKYTCRYGFSILVPRIALEAFGQLGRKVARQLLRSISAVNLLLANLPMFRSRPSLLGCVFEKLTFSPTARMDLVCEKLESMNAVDLDVLIPLTKILRVYLEKAPTFTPVEFCILLFAREAKAYNYRCKLDDDLLGTCFDDLKDMKIPELPTQNLIVDLFMNVVRFRSVLEAVRNDFIKERHFRHDVNSHELLMLIYVLVYRMPTSSFEHSLECFAYYKIPRMLSLVSYILRPETLDLAYTTAVSLFDEDFVEQRIVWPFVDAIPRLEALRLFLREEKKKSEPPKKDLTVPMFMGVLNHPKKLPRLPPPTPEELTVRKFARNVPRSVYKKPATEEKLASIHAENKAQAMSLLDAANKSAPKCWRRRVKNQESTRVEEKQEELIRARMPPAFPKSVEVKQTAASTLREFARIMKDETKEVNKLKELVEGGQDPALILKAEEQRRQQEKEQEIKRMQEKYLSALLAREGVFIAKETLLSNMKSRAESVRRERQELYERLERWREIHSKEMTEIVVKCREIEQASRNAIVAMTDEKRRKGAEVSEESRQLKLSLAKQREEEMHRKICLIQEIKTIQSLKCLPSRDFDPTESSGLGLLCEMSLAELRERLFWTKMRLNEEIEERKSTIRQDRQRQKNLMEDTRKALDEYKANKASNRRSQSSSRMERPICVTSPEILVVRRKLLERRHARLQN